MLTKELLQNQLQEYENFGKPVTVHCSLKSIGEIEGGADTLLSSLIEHFTQDDGLLVIPTHTWEDRVLDLNKSNTCIGVLPTIAAGNKSGFRSEHPSHSVTVFGNSEKAKKFIYNDAFTDTPTSPQGSYGNLFNNDGYVLLIGVGQEKNTFLHCVEEMLGYPRYLKDKVSSSVIYTDGRVIERHLYWFNDKEIPDVSENFGKFEAPFNYYNCIQYGTIGNAMVQFCKAKGMKETMEIIYKRANGRELLSDNSPLDIKLYK